MGKFHPVISPKLRSFIETQQMFFTASSSMGGRVNVSPKGIDSLRVLDECTVAYLDLTGSGNETAAHLRTDGRLTLMFCAFEGEPCILRLFGEGEIVALDSERGRELRAHFPPTPGERHFVVQHVSSVLTSCGYAVPLYDFREQRDMLLTWADKQGPEQMQIYRRLKNSVSIDGFPTGLEEPNYSILAMKADDVGAVFEAFKSWNKPHEQYVRYWRENEEGSRVTIVATDEAETVIGYTNIVWTPEYAPFAEAGIPEINDMNVVGDWQKRGIGTALIKECEKMARHAGHKEMGIGFGLTADYGNAQRLYPKLGYIPDGRGAVPTPWGDVLYLTKKL
ncbi:GNAT family N-acetyltransferase [bacterium]|nr:MAG: GNAT family N-acetyltransferase [bacterium]